MFSDKMPSDSELAEPLSKKIKLEDPGSPAEIRISGK